MQELSYVREDGHSNTRSCGGSQPKRGALACHLRRSLRIGDLAVVAVILTVVGAAAPPTAAQTPSFLGLGQMPGVAPTGGTYAFAISGDGSTIMGYADACADGGTTCAAPSAVRAYRWTVAGGYEVLTLPGSTAYLGAGAVSFDDSVVVGEDPRGTWPPGFRWTTRQGLKGLPLAVASAITPDGKMVAGLDKWWKTTGETGMFGAFPGQPNRTEAKGLTGSAEAPIAAGDAIKGRDAGGLAPHAFRWTPAGGLQDLGVTSGTESLGIAVSGDGAVVVGEATDRAFLWRAFRWTATTGMVDIGTLGGPMSGAFAANRDGSVVVGTSLANDFSDSNRFFRWTPKTGMQDLLPVLQAAGVHNADSWVTLETIVGVSADGTVMVGYGKGPRTHVFPFGRYEPFRIVLPVP